MSVPSAILETLFPDIARSPDIKSPAFLIRASTLVSRTASAAANSPRTAVSPAIRAEISLPKPVALVVMSTWF